MRDTPAWPLSSGTALQIMQRCIGSRGPYGGGVFISAVVIGARESTPRALSSPSFLFLHSVTLSRVHPVVRVFIYRALPLLRRGRAQCGPTLRFMRSACLTHSTLGCALPFSAYLKDARDIFWRDNFVRHIDVLYTGAFNTYG